jgi:hypothetical protein
MGSEPARFETEEYTSVKAKLNPRVFSSIGGVSWPHSYMYCIKRAEIANKRYLLLHYSSQEEDSASAVMPHYGEITSLKLVNNNFSDNRMISPGAIDSDDYYNFLDPRVSVRLYSAIPAATSITYTPETGVMFDMISISDSAYSPVISTATWVYSGTGPTSMPMSATYTSGISNVQNGISVIKTLYYADEGTYDYHDDDVEKHLQKYIKSVYNTDDPAFERADDEGVTTGIGGVSGDVIIGYSAVTPEVEILKEMFGTPVSSDGEYARKVYDETITTICRDMYLTQTVTRRLFLRDSQPNTLTNKDLQKAVKYIEFNLDTISYLETGSYITTTTGGSY